ncbi:MAG: hypothetical protein R3245_02265, partial [Kiloniellales bacterium]|nr:hypothetical protein [Kiloniellales bacterium]
MHFQQLVDGCLFEQVGEGGLEARIFDSYLTRAWDSASRLKDGIAMGQYPFLGIATGEEDLPNIEKAIEPLRSGLDDILFLGTGGSILGGWSLQALARPERRAAKPRLHFV